ncbi:MAG: endopeptidase La [Clostridiales bacterium]|nr:endopeptidase La [Clostridiales bacterium]
MIRTLPVIPLRGMVVLHGEIMHCDAGRKKTLAAIQAAAAADGVAFFCAQRDSRNEEPDSHDFYETGTVCQIRQVFRLKGEGMHMLVSGVVRAYVRAYTNKDPYFEATVCDIAEIPGDAAACIALRRRVQQYFAEYAKLTNKLTNNQRSVLNDNEDDGGYADGVAAVAVEDFVTRQAILEETNAEKRLLLLTETLYKELQVLRVDQEISQKLREEIEKNQKEHYLREKVRVIRRELGETDENEADHFRRRMEEKDMPGEVRERLRKEIARLSMLPSGSHESPMARGYIELLLDLPWLEETKDSIDLKKARRLLDKNHYGMQKVKERIIEYLAVQKLTGKPGGQILCLVGPPGVGKTSIVASIAESMGRKFVRMSLGGIRDEAEIRGHRRTYIGAMPGRVISAMRQAGAINPVLLFDEIDKLASDIRGDPASAMLEVLDSAQNFAFQDHFLELPYDLSKAMILTTANDINTIHRPLLDRMEMINVQSYLAEEKLQIAKRHLLPRQLGLHGIEKTNLRITDGQMANIIHGYTREAGVRELERVLAALCRKAACEVAGGHTRVALNAHNITGFLGQPRYREDGMRKQNEVGVVTGLAYTPMGGETISIEASVVPGNGSIQLTGQLGEVMQESGRAAMTYARAHAREWGLSPDEISTLDVHVHVPKGAVPKDGPSAGVAMAAAIISALSGTPARADIAMTGEITLRGRVLPIGGVREKSLAALRAGITRVLLPADNKKDTEEIPNSARGSIDFLFLDSLDEALSIILAQKPQKTAREDEAPYLAAGQAFVPGYPANGLPL